MSILIIMFFLCFCALRRLFVFGSPPVVAIHREVMGQVIVLIQLFLKALEIRLTTGSFIGTIYIAGVRS